MKYTFGAFQHTSKYAFGGHLQVIVAHSAITTVGSLTLWNLTKSALGNDGGSSRYNCKVDLLSHV
jgi:hypothetical protein